MSEMPNEVHVPAWDQADRMRKALRDIDLGVQEMADFLGVSRNTVSNWINGRGRCPRPSLRLFALRTGVPLPWLESGLVPEADGVMKSSLLSPFPGVSHAA